MTVVAGTESLAPFHKIRGHRQGCSPQLATEFMAIWGWKFRGRTVDVDGEAIGILEHPQLACVSWHGAKASTARASHVGCRRQAAGLSFVPCPSNSSSP